jgi:DNA-binding CsgD family transcriptional regulator/tetratricopeptide (TPR) repeat protein
MSRRWATMKNVGRLRHVVEEKERTGDFAQLHHLYAAAAEQYQQALQVNVMSNGDRLRISEKLAYALFSSGDPLAANRWFDSLLTSYLAAPQKTAETVNLLFKVSRQLWLESKTEASLPLELQAIRLAEASGDPRLCKQAHTKIANTLNILGRFDEAEKFLHVAADIDTDRDDSLDMHYHLNKGYALAASGQAEEAYEDLDRAVILAREHSDFYLITLVWETYALWELALGDITRAKNHYERALLVARQSNVEWYIPFLCIDYAGLLARMGQEAAAYEYLLEAISYDARAPLLDAKFAAVGIPLALHMHDAATLAKCNRKDVVEVAFQSGQPCRIGPVVAAFAQFYAEEGRDEEAQALLHRAIERVTYIDESFDFPIEVARYGLLSDIPKARRLLTARLELPHAEVARALLSLFEMYVEHRNGRPVEARVYAAQAVQAFTTLNWHTCAELARAMLPIRYDIGRVRAQTLVSQPFSDIQPVLTQREQEVAALALRRLTNREIAQTLNISEHTVEKHMTSVMGRLGIHSRRQLANVLPVPTV